MDISTIPTEELRNEIEARETAEALAKLGPMTPELLERYAALMEGKGVRVDRTAPWSVPRRSTSWRGSSRRPTSGWWLGSTC